MKKLLFILLGLTILNVYAADPTYDVTRACITKPFGIMSVWLQSQLCVVVSTNETAYGNYLISMSLQNIVAWATNNKTGVSGGAIDMDSHAAAEKKAAHQNCEQGWS